MADYDFTHCLSPLDFELLSKDLLEAELGIRLENFSEGRDKGIDLRYAPARRSSSLASAHAKPELIVQCKRYTKFSDLKSALANSELGKVAKLEPERYVLTTSVSLSPPQVDEVKSIMSPFIRSTGDIYSRQRLNSTLTAHPEIERRHIKLWATSSGVLDSIVNAKTHLVSREEIERTIAAAKIYVRNPSFDEALAILKEHRVCIISGLPGIGKTTLARMLLLYFYEREFDIVKIESDISEARITYHRKPRFYFYDDFLGQIARADKLNKNEDQKLLDFMASVRDSKDSVFVLTTREYILNQATRQYEKLARERLDNRKCIVDLTKYSRRIRAQILYNHLHFSKLPRPYVRTMVADGAYIRIVNHANYNPRLIEYLTDPSWVGNTPSTEYVSMFIRSLDNPELIWEHAFRNQLAERDRHLLFVLATMPQESLIEDVRMAFDQLHGTECAKLGVPRTKRDFTVALKELDGTFVSTRKADESTLVRFQNPSIRDFVNNLLLEGECLPETVTSLVFFEQAHWFASTLQERKARKQLVQCTDQVMEALKRLMDATASCSLVRYGNEQHILYPRRVAVDPAVRLAVVVTALARHPSKDNTDWMRTRMGELARRIQDGSVRMQSCVETLGVLRKLNLLDYDEGKDLVAIAKQHVLSEALNQPDDLLAFQVVAEMAEKLHAVFDTQELKKVRDSYDAFIDDYVDDCSLDSPEDYRGEASRIGQISRVLGADTSDAEQRLEESADEMESREEEREYDQDDNGGVRSETCSDHELHSMFGTLGD